MDYENIDQFGYEIIVGFKLAAAEENGMFMWFYKSEYAN